VQELESQPPPVVQHYAATKQQQQQQSPRSSSEGAAALHQLEELPEQQPEQPHTNGIAVAADDSAAGKSARLLQELQSSYAALQTAVVAAADASVEVRHGKSQTLCSSCCMVVCEQQQLQLALCQGYAVLYCICWPE
jgi:YesN/AraC family two-component response regulator